MTVDLIFWLAISFELIYLALFLWTIRSVGFRFWPPPSARTWQFFLAWFLAAIVAVFYFLLGLLDFDSFLLPGLWVRAPLAVVLTLAGGSIGGWAAVQFPFTATLGLGNSLITTGPYRFSRNPQYIADSLLIVAYFILTNSWLAGAVGLLGIVLNLVAPFTEESWLEERFGEEYREYKDRVSRFVGRRVRE